MAAPDMPHPARAPHRPQNSAEFHHDADDDDEFGLTASLSLNFRVVVDHWEDCAVLDFGTGARTRRSVVLDDDTCRVFVAGERRSRPINNIVVVVVVVAVAVEENY